MICVVTGDNQHLYGRELEQMFRLREAASAGEATDALDDDTAIYVIRLDTRGDVDAALRLNPAPVNGHREPGWVLSRWTVRGRRQTGR